MTRAACCIILGLAALSPTQAQSIPSAEYRERRAELRKSLDGVLVLMGARDPSDLHDTFYQDPDFEYFTGWHEPGAALLLTPKDEILFLPPRVANRETYKGRTTGPDEKDAVEKSGFEKVLPRAGLETQFVRAMESGEAIYMRSKATRKHAIWRDWLRCMRDATRRISSRGFVCGSRRPRSH